MDKQFSHTRQKQTILILDDNPPFLQAAINLMKHYTQAEVVGSVSKDAALAYVIDHHPTLVLVDMDMPQSCGLEAITQLRKLLPDSKIIAMSMLNDPGFQKFACSAGADALIYKPDLENQITSQFFGRMTG